MTENLDDDSILTINDFSENYKCIPSIEPQSMHFAGNIESASIYIIVLLRNAKAGELDVSSNEHLKGLVEEQYIFYIEDKIHLPLICAKKYSWSTYRKIVI